MGDDQIDLDDLLPEFRFGERHRRRIDAPAEAVWNAALRVTSREVRCLVPLAALRLLPRLARQRRDGHRRSRPAGSLLDDFAALGFLDARRDERPHDGRALALACGAGRFWRPADNTPTRLGSIEQFVSCAESGLAKAAVRLEVLDRGDHTELRTETRVAGTDRIAERHFALYWAVIRGPSGLIRRSWLAAIERRARRDMPHLARYAR
jgi:hypothetical protein